jgi:DNA polymerase-3 subunit alpha
VDLRLNNKRVIESLVKSGSMDSLHVPRHCLFHKIDHAIESAQVKIRDRALGQSALFGDLSDTESGDGEDLSALPEWSEKQRLDYEKETLGFYITGHPLAEYEGILADSGALPIQSLSADDCPPDVKIGGIIASARSTKTKKGAWMGYFMLEDLTGIAEVTVFPELYGRCSHFLSAGGRIFVSGRREKEEENVKILASDIVLLEDLGEKFVSAVQIRLSLPGLQIETAEELCEICSRHPGGCPVLLELSRPGEFVAVMKPNHSLRVRPSEEFMTEVRALLGKDALIVKRSSA